MKLKQAVTLSLASLIMFATAAIAAPEPQKIAVVDIQKVVAASAQVKALKSSQDTRNKELKSTALNENVKGVIRFQSDKDADTIHSLDIRINNEAM